MSEKMSGSCLCGTVKFELAEVPTRLANCHCEICRKASGAPFITFAAAEPSGFRWINEGDQGSYKSSENVMRKFCKNCGSALPTVLPNVIYVHAALLDDPGQLNVAMHIFVKSKAPWDLIHDDLQQFEEHPKF